MARKKHHEEHENHERWLVSYADFITLLFAFFVVMYAVSSVDQKRVVAAEKSVRWAMHFKGNGGAGQIPLFPGSAGGAGVTEGGSTPATHGQGRKTRQVETVRRRLETALRQHLDDAPKPHRVVLEVDGRKLIIRLSTSHFFDPAGAALRPEVFPVLDALAEELGPLQRPIRVDGHTDDRPLTNTRFRSNWELSACRAAAVVQYLEQVHNIPPALLSLGGHGAARPVVSNESAEGRERNRRIDIVVEMDPGGPLAEL
ncbi:MAG: flagellar motor protein MotB [Myxococcota bacterium]